MSFIRELYSIPWCNAIGEIQDTKGIGNNACIPTVVEVLYFVLYIG